MFCRWTKKCWKINFNIASSACTSGLGKRNREHMATWDILLAFIEVIKDNGLGQKIEAIENPRLEWSSPKKAKAVKVWVNCIGQV